MKYRNGEIEMLDRKEYQLFDIFAALTRQRHPADPRAKRISANGDPRETPRRAALRKNKIAEIRARERSDA